MKNTKKQNILATTNPVGNKIVCEARGQNPTGNINKKLINKIYDECIEGLEDTYYSDKEEIDNLVKKEVIFWLNEFKDGLK